MARVLFLQYDRKLGFPKKGGIDMVTGIAHAAFNVKDMDKTVAFYENSLGFKKAFDIARPETGEPWIVYVYAGGGQFIEFFYGATVDNPYRDEKIGFFHICVAVDDIHAIWDRIVETGAPQDDAPKQGADHNWQCWTHDPDGIKIELMQLDPESPQKKFIESMK